MAGSETLSFAATGRKAARVARWVPGGVCHCNWGTDRLFDQLAAHPQGLTAEELAQRTACHAPYVAIWCGSAYRYQLLDAVNGRYVLARHVDSLLAGRAHPDSQAVLFLNAVRRLDHAWHGRLTICTVAPGSHAEAYGTNPTRLDPPPNQEALQRRLWQDEIRPCVPALDAALHNGGRILDVGCGPGLMLLQLAASYPNATFVGVDVVEVGGLETARRLIRERGFDDRIHLECASRLNR